MKNVLVINETIGDFEKNLAYCLQQIGFNAYLKHTSSFFEIFKIIEKHNISVIIYKLTNNFENKDILDLQKIVDKLIIIENGRDIYFGNKLPFSVFNKIVLKSRKSKKIKSYEEQIQQTRSNYVIFRVSELYGPHIKEGLIHDLLHLDKMTLYQGEQDFLYEGDLIHAIEIALKNDAMGIFDIASGKSLKMEEVVNQINKFRQTQLKVRWRKKKEILRYNIENFQYYKWQSLVNLQSGLKSTLSKHHKTLKEVHHGLRSS